MTSDADDDLFFERLARLPVDARPEAASSRLKSRIYSALMRRASQEGPLRRLSDVKHAGNGLCIFEQTVQLFHAGRTVDSLNYCRVCHARILAESLERAPIAWPHCPYAEFQKKPAT